jgi:hypothetical protein
MAIATLMAQTVEAAEKRICRHLSAEFGSHFCFTDDTGNTAIMGPG